MRRFELNGKKYDGAEIDFNTIATFDEYGIKINEIGKKSFAAIRAYVAVSIGSDLDVAGNLINEHIINGGTLEEISKVFIDSVNESGFFLALKKNQTEAGQGKEEESGEKSKTRKTTNKTTED